MTRAEIRTQVIKYFAWRFKAPASDFNDGTSVRRRFGTSAWKALADTFNETEWMKSIKVVLRQSEMGGVSTIGELTDLIFGKQKKK